MARSKTWKRFRKFEKAGLIVLCVVMLATLGIGGGLVCSPFGGDPVAAGEMTIDGEKIEVNAVDYSQFRERFVLVSRLTEPGEMSEDRIERQFLLHQLAKRAGISIPDDMLRSVIQERLFVDRQTGRFDPEGYKNAVFQLRFTSERDFEEALREYLEVQEYITSFVNGLWPTLDDVYDRFKQRQQKFRVAYTWKPMAPFEEAIDRDAFTREELETFYEGVKGEYMIPVKRTIESAYVVLAEVPEKDYQDLYDRLAVPGSDLLVSFKDAWNYYFRQTNVFDDANRKRLAEARERAGTSEEEAETPGEPGTPPEESGTPPEEPATPPEEDDDGTPGEAESTPEQPAPAEPPAGEPAGEPGEPTEEPGEPAGEPGEPTGEPVEPAGEPGEPTGEPGEVAPPPAEEPQLTPREIFETYWLDFVRKELFYRRLAGRVLREAGEEGASLEDVAEKYGFRFLQTKPVADSELRRLPKIGSDDFRFEVVKYDHRHVGQLIPRVLPTTNLDAAILDRGFQIVRIAGVEKAHPSPLKDVEDEIRERLHRKKVDQAAAAAMEEVAEEAKEKGFDETLEARELPRRELKPFGRPTIAPPSSADLTSDDDAVREKALTQARDRYVQVRGRADLQGQADGGISHPIIDRASGSVILAQLLERLDPEPREMSQRDIDAIRTSLYQAERLKMLQAQFSADVLRERLAFRAPGGGRR
jgi:hypothetical protein